MHFHGGVKTTTSSKKSRVKRKVAKNAAIAAGARPTKQAAKAKRPEAPAPRTRAKKAPASATATKKRAATTGSTKAIETAAKTLGTLAGKIARAVDRKAQ